MSDVVKKGGDKTFTVDRYTISVSLKDVDSSGAVLPDTEIVESLALEGAQDTEDAFDRFLNWYLVYRSEFFPTLRRQDITGVKETSRQVNLRENHPAVACHQADIPTKNTAGEVIGNKLLNVTFSKFAFGMLL